MNTLSEGKTVLISTIRAFVCIGHDRCRAYVQRVFKEVDFNSETQEKFKPIAIRDAKLWRV